MLCVMLHNLNCLSIVRAGGLRGSRVQVQPLRWKYAARPTNVTSHTLQRARCRQSFRVPPFSPSWRCRYQSHWREPSCSHVCEEDALNHCALKHIDLAHCLCCCRDSSWNPAVDLQALARVWRGEKSRTLSHIDEVINLSSLALSP